MVVRDSDELTDDMKLLYLLLHGVYDIVVFTLFKTTTRGGQSFLDGFLEADPVLAVHGGTYGPFFVLAGKEPLLRRKRSHPYRPCASLPDGRTDWCDGGR